MKKYLKITLLVIIAIILVGTFVFLYQKSKPKVIVYETLYKRQNKLFHFQKTFCSRFTFINTKQNVHFTTKNRGNLFSCLYFRSEPSKKINGWVKCWILPIL